MLTQVGDYSAYLTLQSLGERYVNTNPDRARRFLEEGVAHARRLEQPRRTFALATLGNLVRRAGKDKAGRQLIDEAAAIATTMGKDGLQELARLDRRVLASYDLARAMSLLDPITDHNSRERYLGNIVVALAPHDLDKALAIVNKFGKQSTAPDRARMRIAYAIAPSQPAQAIRIVEKMDSHGAAKMKADAFGWLAVSIAPTDKKLAWSLIDRSMSIYQNDPEASRGWSNYGGASVMAARIYGQARAIGYPDLDSLGYRVLAMRTTNQYDSPTRVLESMVATAMVLALSNPVTAKQILEGIETDESVIGTGFSSVRREHLFLAWALADPKHAAELFDKELVALNANPDTSLQHSGLAEMAEILTVAEADRAYHLLRFFGSFWFPGEE